MIVFILNPKIFHSFHVFECSGISALPIDLVLKFKELNIGYGFKSQ